ncbi:MAG: helicase RepA family protein [Parachlamydia sp.]|nr:helicase RepA family protein [Parachlamydia sp.]
METNAYLLFTPNGNVQPLQDKFRELGGFYNGLGYAFPSKSEPFLKELVARLPKAKIHKLPLGEGQSFAAFQQTHKASFFQSELIKINKKLTSIGSELGLDDVSEDSVIAASILDSQKQTTLELLQERAQLTQALEWAIGMEKTLTATGVTNRPNLRFISELETNYLERDAPPKPRLLYWTDNTGAKQTFLHSGIVAALIAAGGVGKTHILTQLALCAALGLPFLGKFEFDRPKNACLIVGENDDADMHRLLQKTRKALEKWAVENEKKSHDKIPVYHDKLPFESAAKRLIVHTVHGAAAQFLSENGCETEFYGDLLQELKTKEPEGGWDLIILDPLSRFAGLETETDNATATTFVSKLEKLSKELKGKPTVMISHHKSKAAIGSADVNQTAGRGSSAITDGVRWQGDLRRDQEPGKTILEITKTNFTAYLPKMILEKGPDGTLLFSNFEDKKTGAREQISTNSKRWG